MTDEVENFGKLMEASAIKAFDVGEGGYWAYANEAFEETEEETGVVGLFRATGGIAVIMMPETVWRKWREAVKEAVKGGKDGEAFSALLKETAYKPKT